jgi:hypothetical protein
VEGAEVILFSLRVVCSSDDDVAADSPDASEGGGFAEDISPQLPASKPSHRPIQGVVLTPMQHLVQVCR